MIGIKMIEKNKTIETLYKNQQNKYKKEKRKAKKNFECLQNETVDNEEAMAKKIKSLTSNIQPKVTTLKLPNGNHTEVGKETFSKSHTKNTS